jgi:surfactin synthase thioesterase subunit
MTPEAVEAAKGSDDYFMGLCEHYAAGIRMIQPHGPYTIGGISLGSLIALGIASVLEKEVRDDNRRVVPIGCRFQSQLTGDQPMTHE